MKRLMMSVVSRDFSRTSSTARYQKVGRRFSQSNKRRGFFRLFRRARKIWQESCFPAHDSWREIKSEIRISKSEINSKSQARKRRTGIFEPSDFGFVSDFEIRIRVLAVESTRDTHVLAWPAVGAEVGRGHAIRRRVAGQRE